jgi:hypothetical protein
MRHKRRSAVGGFDDCDSKYASSARAMSARVAV